VYLNCRIAFWHRKMRNLIKITDLPAADYMFYIGDLVEVDGDGWVSEDAALVLLTELNTAPIG